MLPTFLNQRSKFTIDHIPNKPGVYFFKDKAGNILYIGKAKDLKKRVGQYFSPGSVWKQDMVNKAHMVDFVMVKNESEALYLEDNLIKKHKPPYNSLLKGDNTYIFIKITNEEFPRVLLTRKRKQDKAKYIGPKRGTRVLKKVLQHTRMIFQYRGCTNSEFKKGKLCSDYYFGLCKGRCVFAKLQKKSCHSGQSKEADPESNHINKKLAAHQESTNSENNPYIQEAQKYGLKITKTREEYIQENKEIMKHMATLFDGNPQPMIDEVHRQIQMCIKTENFERAARLKEVYQGLENFRERQHVVLDVSMTGRVAKIQKMSDWYVYVLVRLHEGRLVDLVRHKLSTHDENINAIMAMFQAEYGIDRRKIQQDGKYYTTDTVFKKEKQKDDLTEKVSFLENRSKKGLIGLSKGVKHFTSVSRQLDQVLEKFLDAYLLSSSWEKESVMNDLLNQLQSKYYFKHYPYRIECIDISHLSGGRMSGGLSCLVGGIPYKNNYRRYKIKEAKKSDDYKALREIIKRRFKLTKSAKEIPIPQDELPSVFILDGGKGQLGVLKKMREDYPILEEIMVHTQFCALEKGDARQRSAKSSGAHETLYIFTDDGEIIHKNLTYDKADRLLTGLRDEAHRFANAYRKKRMSKEWK